MGMAGLGKTLSSVGIAMAIGAAAYEFYRAHQLEAQVGTLGQAQAPLANEVAQLRQERDNAKTRSLPSITNWSSCAEIKANFCAYGQS
jgi:hypothetical protein